MWIKRLSIDQLEKYGVGLTFLVILSITEKFGLLLIKDVSNIFLPVECSIYFSRVGKKIIEGKKGK